MISEETDAHKPQQSITADSQPRTRTTSVMSNPNIRNTETIESIPFTEATENLIPFRPTLFPGKERSPQFHDQDLKLKR